MRVTLKEVAKKAGVSITAVSFVLNGRAHEVSKQTAKKIMDTIETLNYVPDMRAKQLKSGQSKLIALMVPDILNPFYTMIADEAMRVLSENNYTLALMNYRAEESLDIENAKLLLTNTFDGSLIVSSNVTNLKPIIESPNVSPFILLDESDCGDHYMTVTGNNLKGGKLVGEYLIKLGHQKFACLSGPQTSTTSQKRLKGFQEALKKHDFGLNPELILAGEYTFESGYQRAKQLFENKVDVTALVCMNDLIAYGAIKALEELNYRVGDDISVIGYDNIQNYTNYKLTTIDQRVDLISDKSVELLIDQIKHKKKSNTRTVIDPILIEGTTVKNLKEDC